MSQRIRNRLHDRDTINARHERLQHAYKYGEYIDEHTTTTLSPKVQKLMDKMLDRFLYGDKK